MIATAARSAPRGALAMAALLLLTASFGCSMSTSSSGSFESSSASSASSSPESKEATYRNDVRDLTAAYAGVGGSLEAFQRQLGDLARKHGISNWEESPVTYDGIGRGLGKARVGPTELDRYTRDLAGPDAAKAKAIQDGYTAGAS